MEANKPAAVPTDKPAGPPHVIPPARIGILLGDVRELNAAALKYLVLRLNTLQQFFEFEWLPVPNGDPVMVFTGGRGEIDREELRRLLPPFLGRLRAFLATAIDGYGLAQRVTADRFILLTMAKFKGRFYAVDALGVRVLALGNWEPHMAPPSLLEAFVTLIMRQAVALVSPSFTDNIHLGTKGCLFDFTPLLSEARFRILQGFICSDCRGALDSDGLGQLADKLLPVLDTARWLGKPEEPTAPAGVVAKLGYDLFLTRGIKPSWREKIQTALRDEGVKEVVRIIGYVVAAALVFWFGLKKC